MSGLQHVGFMDRGGLLVPGSAGVALLDERGQPLAVHGEVAATEGGVLYPRPSEPTCIDVFCGCGGASLGFQEAGFRVAAAIDLELHALATYWINICGPGSRWHGPGGIVREHVRGEGNVRYPDDVPPGWAEGRGQAPYATAPVQLFQRDVSTISVEELLRAIDLPPGAVDLMHGSPPCQGFSLANSHRFIDDPRNALYKEFIRLVAGVRPKHVSIENVAQMLTFGDAWQHIEQDLRDLGYAVGAKVIDAVSYGVPQFRARTIVSANRVGHPVSWPVPSTWGDHDLRAFREFPDLSEAVGASAYLTPDPEPTELCMVFPIAHNDGPYIARLVERRDNKATMVDPWGKRRESQWTTVLGFGAHTRQMRTKRQRSLFAMAGEA